MINSFEISLLIIISLTIVGLIILNLMNKGWVEKSQQASKYKSFNVPQGKSLILNASEGYEINIDKVFVGTGPPPGANESQIIQCYAAMNPDSGNGGPQGCKISTQVYGPNNPLNIKDTTISSKCNGKIQCTVSADELSEVITAAGRSCGAESGGLCIPYIFGVYENVKS